MPPKPKAPMKEIKITDKPDYSEETSDSEYSDKIIEKEENLKISKSIRSCVECKKQGLSPTIYNSHISSNRSCPSKLESVIVSSKKPIVNNKIKPIVTDKNIEIEKQSTKNDFKFPDKEKELKQIKENEKNVGLKLVNNLLDKRLKEDDKEKLKLPVIPKRKLA